MKNWSSLPRLAALSSTLLPKTNLIFYLNGIKKPQ
jgi:hypothetical protein